MTCPVCGKKSWIKSNPSGRCRSCLDKLRKRRNTPGDKERAWHMASDAKRREEGKNGTAHKKHKGKMKSEGELAKKIQRAEEKTGEKLSPDRKDNSKGYEDSNVRFVPKHLNRGRHTVDEKKLKEWKKKLKKSDITVDDIFFELIKSLEITDPQEIEELENLVYYEIFESVF